MLRRLLAIAVPLFLAAALHASGATLPRPSSASTARAAGPVGTAVAAPGAASATQAPTRGRGASGVARTGGVAPGVTAVIAVLRGTAPSSASNPAAVESPLFGASGDAINIDPLGTCIACTGAGAASRDSSSYSRSIKVADESIAEGESPANGYTSGSIVSLPPNPLLMLAIGTWRADNHHDGASAEGHSYASAAELALSNGGVATVALFQAQSDATRDRRGQYGSASSNAGQASLGGGHVTIVILHSDTSTNQRSHVYIAQVNEQRLMTSDELMGGLPLTVPNVASVYLFRDSSNRAVVGDVADGQSNGAAEIVSTSAGNTSGPRNQTH